MFCLNFKSAVVSSAVTPLPLLAFALSFMQFSLDTGTSSLFSLAFLCSSEEKLLVSFNKTFPSVSPSNY